MVNIDNKIPVDTLNILPFLLSKLLSLFTLNNQIIFTMYPKSLIGLNDLNQIYYKTFSPIYTDYVYLYNYLCYLYSPVSPTEINI